MNKSVVGYEELDEMLQRSPVVADVQSLVPLALSDDTELIYDAKELQLLIDNYHTILGNRLLILDDNEMMRDRFPYVNVPIPPSSRSINQNMHYHLEYARSRMLTNRRVASHIELDVVKSGYDIVVLLLIDGLSYQDVAHWGNHVVPCFVDGVSVTYQFDDADNLLRTVGFAALLNQPSIFVRLYRHNYRNSLGFTYWRSKQNKVSEYLFQGIPLTQVENFQAVQQILLNHNLQPNTYIQIMREGLDGMAHGKRELHVAEISGAITAIERDIQSLIDILRKTELRCVLYLTADHGILWKTHHDFLTIDIGKSKSRYSLQRPDDKFLDYVLRIEHENIPYYLLKYPYIGAKVRSNDSGLHGGLSYQESIVPFAKIEVG